MSPGSKALAAAALLLVATIGMRAQAGDPRQQASPPAPTTAPIASAAGDYLGSESCMRCHEAEHAQWKNSLHIKMTRPVAEATLLGDFRDGTKFSDHGRSYQFGTKDGKPWISISFGGAPPETFDVSYTLGAKRFQGYLAMLPAGRIFVLPVFWHVESKRWVDWKEITPIPDGAHDIRQIWNANCFNCHATNIVQGFDVNDKAYNSTWTELGIGCEACHGPGKPHVELMDAWEKNPASKPAYDNSEKNRQLTDILKTMVFKSAEPRRIYDTCAYCHGNKNNAFVGFKAGDRYEDYAVPFLVSEPIPENDLQGEFWPDGRPNRFNRSQALALSGCFNAGAITCTNCHVAHGSPNEYSLKLDINDGMRSDELCTQCHTTPKLANRQPPEGITAAFAGPGLQGHTFHAPQSEGSRCINCHMSNVNWRLLIRRRDHTFQPPVPESTAQFGIPNACTTCHDEKSPEWAAKQMNEWWGDDARRSKAARLADVMYRAGAGDGSTLPDLARIALDRSQGFIIRASAADYIGRLVAETRTGSSRKASSQSQTSFGMAGDRSNARRNDRPNPLRKPAEPTPATVNALIGAANDPEPVVRVAAVGALGMIGDRERSLPPITARLVDQTRVVRSKAAEMLAHFGIVTLPGAAGEALTKAQNEYVLSLDSFPDGAANHAAKGWFEAERGNVLVARDALNKATQVEPNFAFPWVVKGVLLAREGKFSEAAEMWKKARSIEPSYPNIEQLIAEAEKRK